MIGQLNLAVWAWAESLRGLRQKQVLVPFLILGALQAFILLVMTQFYQPILSWLVAPILRLLGGNVALHYPQFYLVLPGLFSRANFLIDFLVGTLVVGVSFLIIWRSATGESRRTPWREARGQYLRLLLLRLPVVLILFLLYELIPYGIHSTGRDLQGNALRLLRYGSFFFACVADWIFLFTPLALLVQGRSIGGSFRESFAMLRRAPLAGFLIVLVPNLIQIPLSAVMRRSDSIVRSLAPEMVAWVLVGGILVTVAANYVVVASAVRVFGARTEGGIQP